MTDTTHGNYYNAQREGYTIRLRPLLHLVLVMFSAVVRFDTVGNAEGFAEGRVVRFERRMRF